jgi:TIR domain
MKIFVSYRRDDSIDVTGRLCDHLRARFGRRAVLLDIDTIPLGIDYAETIRQMISAADAVLVVIGPRWLDVRFRDGPQAGRRRLDDSRDVVRIEIATSLVARNTTVIPILVGGAAMPPSAALPTELRHLTDLAPVEIASGPLFLGLVHRLARRLEQAELVRGAIWPARLTRAVDQEVANRALGSWNLRALVGNLNRPTRAALEAAAGLAASMHHHELTPAHWLDRLLDHGELLDLDALLMHVDASKWDVRRELRGLLAQLPDAAAGPPTLADAFGPWMAAAWAIASVELREESVRSSHLLYALARDRSVAAGFSGGPTFHRALQALQLLQVDQHLEAVAGSDEEMTAAALPAVGPHNGTAKSARSPRHSRPDLERRIAYLQAEEEQIVADPEATPIDLQLAHRRLFDALRDLGKLDLA